MNNIRARDIKALKRRMEFLTARMENNGMADTGRSYDAAEYNALKNVLEAIDGEEAEV